MAIEQDDLGFTLGISFFLLVAQKSEKRMFLLNQSHQTPSACILCSPTLSIDPATQAHILATIASAVKAAGRYEW